MSFSAMDDAGNWQHSGSNPSPMMRMLMGTINNLIQQREEEDRAEALEAESQNLQPKENEMEEIPDTLPLFFGDEDEDISSKPPEEPSSSSAAAPETNEDHLEKSKAFHNKKKQAAKKKKGSKK